MDSYRNRSGRSATTIEDVWRDDRRRLLALASRMLRDPTAERTSFVLHDVFGVPYGEIGELVGRTATACRQLASRARRTVHGPLSSATPISLASDEHRRLVGRFAAACSAGDLAGLVAVLDPDVGSVTTTLDGVQLGSGDGADHVAMQAIRFLGPASGTTIVPVLGERGVDLVARYPDGRRGVFELEVAKAVISRLRITVIASCIVGPERRPAFGESG